MKTKTVMERIRVKALEQSYRELVYGSLANPTDDESKALELKHYKLVTYIDRKGE